MKLLAGATLNVTVGGGGEQRAGGWLSLIPLLLLLLLSSAPAASCLPTTLLQQQHSLFTYHSIIMSRAVGAANSSLANVVVWEGFSHSQVGAEQRFDLRWRWHGDQYARLNAMLRPEATPALGARSWRWSVADCTVAALACRASTRLLAPTDAHSPCYSCYTYYT